MSIKKYQNRNIKYLNKDFSSFRKDLINYSQTYFPDTYNDFTPSSLGMMFMEQASYVGDVLSFYLDSQFTENFLQYSKQFNNIYDLAYMFGYKPKTTTPAQVTIDVYQQIPSKVVGVNTVPDYDYALSIEAGATISTDYVSFITQDKVDFSSSSSFNPTEITVYQTLGDTPQYYLLKKSVNAISGQIKTKRFNVGNSPTPFLTLKITDENIINIQSVTADGQKYSEVDHLGQEMVFKQVKNNNINIPNTSDTPPYFLQLKKVSTRFTSRLISQNEIEIQFGTGNSDDVDETIIPNPNNVGLGLPFKQDKLTTAFSPSNFLYTGTYGIAPTGIVIISYVVGGGVTSNIEANTLTTLKSKTAVFNNSNLNPTTANYVFTSLSCNNPEAARGGKDGDTIEEIRENALAQASAQKRTVTPDDYLIRALSMPPSFGSVYKAFIEKPKLTDQTSTINTLNMYILTQDSSQHLSFANTTLKNNLRTYLSQYRMIGDSIEIKDAFIINIGIEFEIIVLPEFNNNSVLTSCIQLIRSIFELDKISINDPIYLKNLFIRLDNILGVQTVKSVKVLNKAGTTSGYSQYAYDIDAATQNQIIYPSLDPSIFEIKNPNQDIKGRVVPL
mgnify:CR=1 FL=1|tara:strand:+ start:449 stop:2293 length:1845 start_codon:yes stop_codon:yes gene_type:complete